MSDERAEANRGIRAKAILEDELVLEAFAALEARYLAAWRSSEYTDTAGREEVYRMLRATQALRAEFETMIRDGKVAEAIIAAEKAKAT
jgi:hypothetical protein